VSRAIPLSKGQVALVDDSDYEWLMQWKWAATWSSRTHSYYAVRTTRDGEAVLMHRAILNAQPGQQVDHRNHRTLDNRRKNIRLCSLNENRWNARKRSNNTSGLIGVHWDINREKWQSRIGINGKTFFLGYFTDKVEAARVRDAFAVRLHGDFAVLNFPEVAA
jgi:hypothetical protein